MQQLRIIILTTELNSKWFSNFVNEDFCIICNRIVDSMAEWIYQLTFDIAS